MNPHVTFRDVMGQRIYGIETPAGFVYCVTGEVFDHESEAVQTIRTLMNPVVVAMEEQAEEDEE